MIQGLGNSLVIGPVWAFKSCMCIPKAKSPHNIGSMSRWKWLQRAAPCCTNLCIYKMYLIYLCSEFLPNVLWMNVLNTSELKKGPYSNIPMIKHLLLWMVFAGLTQGCLTYTAKTGDIWQLKKCILMEDIRVCLAQNYAFSERPYRKVPSFQCMRLAFCLLSYAQPRRWITEVLPESSPLPASLVSDEHSWRTPGAALVAAHLPARWTRYWEYFIFCNSSRDHRFLCFTIYLLSCWEISNLHTYLKTPKSFVVE